MLRASATESQNTNCGNLKGRDLCCGWQAEMMMSDDECWNDDAGPELWEGTHEGAHEQNDGGAVCLR